MRQTLKDILAVYMTRRGKKRDFSYSELEIKHAKPEVPSFKNDGGCP